MYNISDDLASIIRNGLTTTNSKIEVGEDVLDDNDIYSFELSDDLGIDGQPSIGSVISKSLKLEIVKSSASIVLSGSEIKPSLGYNLDEDEDDITIESDVEYIPLGSFYADPSTVQYSEDKVTVDCYDKMYFWDNVHYATTLTYPASVHDMLEEIATLTGIDLADINQITDVTWLSRPSKSIRQMLSAIAELEGKQAIITRDGKIGFIQNHVPFNIKIKGKSDGGVNVADSGNINVYVMDIGVSGSRNLTLNSKGDFVFQAQNTGRDTDNFNCERFYASMTIGKTYTISADIVVNSGNVDRVTVYPYPGEGSSTVLISNGKIVYTFTKNSTSTDSVLIYAGKSGQTRGKSITLSNLKVEEGTTDTTWIPALEDSNITDYCTKHTLAGLPKLYSVGTTNDYIEKSSSGIWKVYHNCEVSGGVVSALTTPYSEALSQANQTVLNSIVASPDNKIFVTSDLDPEFDTNVDLYAFDSNDYNQGGLTLTGESSITKLINHLAVEEEETGTEEEQEETGEETEEETEEETDPDISYGGNTGKSLTIENENIRTLERLQALYNKCFPMTWRAFTLSMCYGCPWIDTGDIIAVKDVNDTLYYLPVMSHIFRYNGGATSEMSASIGEEDSTVSYSEDYSHKIINTEKNVGHIRNQITGINSNVDGVTTRVTTVEQTVTRISQTVEENYTALHQAIDDSGTYSIKVESDSAYAVKADKTYNLSCFVYRINENITNNLDVSQFRWFRVSTDKSSDMDWNAPGHTGSHLAVTSADINEDSCAFYCEVTIYTGNNVALIDRDNNRLCYRDGSPIMIKEVACILKTGVPMKDSTDNYKATFEMVKDKILLMLDNNGKLAYINLQSGSTTLLKLLADMISLEGLVTANEYFKILLDGSIETSKITVKAEDGSLVITSQGLKLCFVYESSGNINGYQDLGWTDYGGTVVSMSAIMSAFIPAGITITKATLKTIVISRDLTNVSSSGLTAGKYSPKQIKMSYSSDDYPKAIYSYPYSGSPTLGIASGTDYATFGTWSPTAGTTPQTKDVDVTSLVQSGKYITFNAYSNKTYAQNDEWYSGGICKMVLVVEGYKKG